MLKLLTLSVISLASVTAYFAVFGLAALAPTVSGSMIALGLSLEFAKYTAVTFVYAHWTTLPRLMRYSLATVIVSVMLLTSTGVFGYLQSAFSSSLAINEQTSQQLADTVTRRADLEAQLQAIDAETKRAPESSVRGRLALLKAYGERRASVAADLQSVRATEQELRAKNSEVRAHTGPLAYVATALSVPLERAVLWMALLLTVSLDPLAMLLSLSIVYMRGLRGTGSTVEVKAVNDVNQTATVEPPTSSPVADLSFPTIIEPLPHVPYAHENSTVSAFAATDELAETAPVLVAPVVPLPMVTKAPVPTSTSSRMYVEVVENTARSAAQPIGSKPSDESTNLPRSS